MRHKACMRRKDCSAKGEPRQDKLEQHFYLIFAGSSTESFEYKSSPTLSVPYAHEWNESLNYSELNSRQIYTSAQHIGFALTFQYITVHCQPHPLIFFQTWIRALEQHIFSLGLWTGLLPSLGNHVGNKKPASNLYVHN